MNRSTGKTLSDCFVELCYSKDLQKALVELQNKPLKGRLVTLELASQSDLLQAMFPQAYTSITNITNATNATVPPSVTDSLDLLSEFSFLQSKENSSFYVDETLLETSFKKQKTFLKREEIQSILTICKNYKASFF